MRLARRGDLNRQCEPGDGQPFLVRKNVDAAPGERQQHGVDDAVVGLAAAAVLGGVKQGANVAIALERKGSAAPVREIRP